MTAIDPLSQTLGSAAAEPMVGGSDTRSVRSELESETDPRPTSNLEKTKLTDANASFKAVDERIESEPKIEYIRPEMPAMTKVVRFEALARCGDEVWIENEGQMYRLRRTRQGKLILTK